MWRRKDGMTGLFEVKPKGVPPRRSRVTPRSASPPRPRSWAFESTSAATKEAGRAGAATLEAGRALAATQEAGRAWAADASAQRQVREW